MGRGGEGEIGEGRKGGKGRGGERGEREGGIGVMDACVLLILHGEPSQRSLHYPFSSRGALQGHDTRCLRLDHILSC